MAGCCGCVAAWESASARPVTLCPTAPACLDARRVYVRADSFVPTGPGCTDLPPRDTAPRRRLPDVAAVVLRGHADARHPSDLHRLGTCGCRSPGRSSRATRPLGQEQAGAYVSGRRPRRPPRHLNSAVRGIAHAASTCRSWPVGMEEGGNHALHEGLTARVALDSWPSNLANPMARIVDLPLRAQFRRRRRRLAGWVGGTATGRTLFPP